MLRGLGAAAALPLLACSTAPSRPAQPSPVTLTIGSPQVSQIDPTMGLETLAGLIANERLTASDSHGRAQPLLLERWSISDDGLTWRLTVRDGLRFHDGTALTPADVVRTIDEDRRLWGRDAACLGDITRVATAGTRDVEVTLARRCGFLLDDLRRAVTRQAGPGQPRIGTGPFSIASQSANELVLEANPQYHRGRPAADRVVVRRYDTLRTASADMMRGELDFLLEVGPDSAEFLADQATIDARTFISAYANMLLLNSARPALRPPGVRRALNLAVDRVALVLQGQKGHGVPATVPTWPRHWARGEAPRPLVYDPDAAAALLDAERGRRTPAAQPGGLRLEFSCLVPAKFAMIERLALLVQRQFAEAGVRMHLESVPAEVLQRRLGSGDFDALLLPFLSGPYASVPYRTWHSAGATRRWNYWGYRSAPVDAALDAMRDARDDAAFTQALRRFESAFEDDPPAVLLTWNEQIQAVSRRFLVPKEADDRDAMHFLRSWTLRKPGQDQP